MCLCVASVHNMCAFLLSVEKDIRVVSNDSAEENKLGVVSVTVSSALIPLKQASGN